MTTLSRKAFLSNTCKAACVLAGGSAFLTLLEGCAPFKVYSTKTQDGILSVPLAEFATEKSRIVRDNNLDSDIFLSKTETGYIAIKMKCTHQDWLLTATGSGFACSSHGSTFATDGKVTNGPATEPLKQLKTTLTNTTIQIYLNQ